MRIKILNTNTIVFSCTDKNYMKLAVFWAEFLESLKIYYMIYCVDIESFEYLKKNKISCKNIRTSETYNFKKIDLLRFELIIDLLKTYDSVVYSDLDAIWLENPLQKINYQNCDANLSTATHIHACPWRVRDIWGFTFCTGWMQYKRTMREFISYFVKNYTSFKGNGQAKFNHFLFSLNHEYNEHTHFNFYFDGSVKYINDLNQSIISRRKQEYYLENNEIDFSSVEHPILGTAHDQLQKIKVIKDIYINDK